MTRKKASVVGVGLLLLAELGLGLWLRGLPMRLYPETTTEATPGPAKEAPAKIAAIGDVSCSRLATPTPTTCQGQAVRDAIRITAPSAVLLLGDLQYDRGEPENFLGAFMPLWQDLKSRTYSVPGNHEYMTTGAKGYFDYWNATAASSVHAGERDKGYYSFDIQDWHMVALNSNCEFVGGCDSASPQGQWLKQDLSTHRDAKCTLAFWHHPRFTSGRYAASKSTPLRSEYFWQELYQAGADVVLNGHDHLYERLAKQNAAGQLDGRGVRQFTVGTGGYSLYSFTTTIPQHEFGSSSFGFLSLTLEDIGYEWSFLTPAGQELDKGSSVCNNPYKT